MLSNLFRNADYFIRELCSLQCAGNRIRVRKTNARLEIGINLHLRRVRELIRVGQLLFETKRDFTNRAQSSSYYPRLSAFIRG